MKKRTKYQLSLVGLLIILLSVSSYFSNTLTVFAKSEYSGDKYVTSTKITDSSNHTITTNGTMEINEIYNLDYEWVIPDNTYKNGDVLEFSIPKEFKIVQNFKFNLYKDGNEVARVNILGNADNGYYISMQFTTDYVETHSSVSGTFNLSYVLNEKYIQTDGDNTIILPDKEIVIHVPKPDEGSSGGGSGVGSGNTNWNKKEGDAILVNLPETPNETSTVFNWNIGLGRTTLLGKATSFDEIKHIYIEDTPYDQKMVSFGDFSPGWAGSYGFEGGFFSTLPWEYGGVSQDRMGLIRDSSNTYYSGFKTDILPAVQKYEKLAQDNNSEFKQYKLEYYTTPLNEVLEDTEFKNDATITIVYNDNSEKVWTLSESQMYNVADGTITGKTAGVEFKKIDSITNEGLGSAVFDLYKKNITGDFAKVKSNITSGADGKVRVDSLTTGEYYFTEVQAPKGYETSTDKLNFTIETKDLSEPNQSLVYKNIGSFKNNSEITKTSISVKKVWDDQNNQDGKRPNGISVQLYADDKKHGDPILLNEANQWQHTWAELDEKANGKDIVYTVKEVDTVDGYDMTLSTNDLGNVIITNTHIPETTEVTGAKTWDDKNDQDGKRPKEITVNLLADGVEIDQKKVTSETNWAYTFTNLPKYKDGELIQYTVTESHVPDYSTEINGTSIKNSYTPGQTSLTVTKAWNDANNQDGKRPNGINVQLYADDKKQGDPIVLNEANQWQHTWTELDEKANGKDIVYTVKEIDTIDGYEATINKEDIGNIIITNTHTPETTGVAGTKTWDDKNNQDGKRPKEITVNLLADGVEVDQKTVTSETNWAYEFSNLPKYKDGELIQYTVTESHVPDYSTEINGTSIKNSYTPGQTSLTVTKAWNDANNQDGKRPNGINVQLYADDKKQGDPIVLNEANQWQHTWTELDEKANGKDIVYTVKEIDTIDGYEATINKEDIGNIIITNTHTPETTGVAGTKTWDDKNDQDGKRPKEITVNLLADGVEIDQKKVTSETNWAYTFTNLPKYKDGELIQYTVTESHVPDYSTEINGTSIKNSYTPGQTSLTVTKAWNDANNQDGKRPNGINVQLYADDKKQGDPIVLNEANQWQHTWTELDEKANGKDIVYTVKEIDTIDGYEATINKEDIGNIIITNTHTPETTGVAGTKTWDDKNNQDGKRPKEITVNLLADGVEVDQKTVTSETNWAYEFSNLPKYKDGELIQYTVTESHVPDYSTEINGTSIKNSYTPGQTSLTVTKAWNDANNQDGKRPNGINVQLYADDKKQGDPIVLNEANQWQHTWTELDEKANGKDIVYTVKEIDTVDGYDMTINNNDLGNVIITNTHTPETTELAGTKTWDDKNNQDGKRPDNITVLLLADGVLVDEQKVTEENNWHYEFINLPKYNNGKEVHYAVMERQVPSYSTEISDNNLINHYTPGKTSVSVTKAWDDANDNAGKRPKQVQVQLYANGEKHGEIVSLSSKNNWQYTWTNLDEKFDGKEIIYTIKEVDVPKGYVSTINDANKHAIILTNSYPTEKITSFSNTETPSKPSNTTKQAIPSLGGINSTQLFFVGLLLIALSATIYQFKKSK